jgi:oligopeptide/dipeptide ABC transporter ATP-binding protein
MTGAATRKVLLEVRDLHVHYRPGGAFARGARAVKALNGVSLKLHEGETYGLVGESGCGKSTLGRTILRLQEATAGEVIFEGRDLLKLPAKQMRAVRRRLQMVFQDPFTSLNPRQKIGGILKEALAIHGIASARERDERVNRMLVRIGLQPEHAQRYPHELSGGQRQRIGLARALILEPQIVVCDEPVSALDVVIQSQIINLMRALQEELKLTYLFIAHDIGVVRYISDRIGIMYLGRLVEEAETDALFASPRHPYTKALLSAVPVPDPLHRKERIQLKGELPSPLNVPGGCAFHTRCPYATDLCRTDVPELKRLSDRHAVACHHADHSEQPNPRGG